MAERSCLQQNTNSCDGCLVQRQFVGDLNRYRQTPIQVIRANRAEMSCPSGVAPEARLGTDPLDEGRGFVLVSDLRIEELERFALKRPERIPGVIRLEELPKSGGIQKQVAVAGVS